MTNTLSPRRCSWVAEVADEDVTATATPRVFQNKDFFTPLLASLDTNGASHVQPTSRRAATYGLGSNALTPAAIPSAILSRFFGSSRNARSETLSPTSSRHLYFALLRLLSKL